MGISTGFPRNWRPVPAIAAFLAFAGLPIYIHLPRFAAELGFSLGTIGALLLLLRLLDFVQDPLLGHLVDRLPSHRSKLAATAFLGMGAGFLIVFALQPGLAGLSAGLVLVFTAFSLGTILFYGQAADLVGKDSAKEHYRLAGIRETGALAGIIVAAILPGLLAAYFGALTGYALFGIFLALFSIVVWRYGQSFWTTVLQTERDQISIFRLFRPDIRQLLIIAFVNALPVAITSTLFLFFVEDRLGLPDLAGVYLLLFFLAAGLTAPLWSRLAANFGARRVLLPAMTVAILAFIGASLLPAGSAWIFGLITLASGAALGADMVIIPALFASKLAREGVPTGIAFGIWSFSAKLSLAIAAALVLPVLQYVDYQPGGINTPSALSALNMTYAVVPCVLKVLAMALVAGLRDEKQ